MEWDKEMGVEQDETKQRDGVGTKRWGVEQRDGKPNEETGSSTYSLEAENKELG